MIHTALRRPAFASPLCRALVAAAVLFSITAVPIASARVLSLEIERRVPLLEGRAFGARGAYEMIEGRVTFGFDPKKPANARVSDLLHVPLGKSGLVEASADFVVLQAVDPEKRSGTALVDVPNRGRRLGLATLNRAQLDFTSGSAELDPAHPRDWGDGFLMEQGLTVIWVGWQADAPSTPGSMSLRVPHAVAADGSPIRGLARSDWVVDEPTESLPLAALGHAPIPAADPASSKNVLTRRRGREAERQTLPRSAWTFSEDRTAIAMEGGFESGWIYELVYVAQDPLLVGLGFTAFRDIAAYARRDPKSPFPIQRAIANGSSQSGRFLRHFLYEGFNQDETDQPVFDGVIVRIGGAGRGGFNHRFAHPGRVGNPYANFFYPGDEFPFTSRPSEADGRSAGLLDRARATGQPPRVFQINTGYEYWGRAASLIHMTPDGKQDVEPLGHERLYHIASAPHYALPFPPAPRSEVIPGLYVGSAVDTSAIHRALLVHMLRWVEDNVAPPDSLIPKIADGTLVEFESLDYPIASLTRPRSPHVAYRVDYGPRWSEGIIDFQPPHVGPAFAIRVPGIDGLGSEATGILPMELRAPIGTYTPWALRHGAASGADEMAGYIGSFLPLARTEAMRREGDIRPALETLYPDRDAYEKRVAEGIDQMVQAGWMLPRDRARAFDAARERWEWITRPDPAPTDPAPVSP